MKKAITILLSLAILSGCSTKISLVKRKYNKGFFVSVSSTPHKNNETKTKIGKNKTTKPEQATELAATEMVKAEANNPVIETKITNTQNQSIATSTKKQHGFKQHKLKTDKVTNENLAKNNTYVSAKTFFGKSNQNTKAASDTDKLIMIILALFPVICLIAVYLKDGGITLNFWIDLLLHITLIGEVVFALLVVLDIVSLA